MRRLFLLSVLLILYGSLYPWQFRDVSLSMPPWWILLHSWPRYLPLYTLQDGVVNLILYAPLGLFGALSLPRQAAWIRFCLPVLAGFLLSSSVEMLQLFDRTRFCSALDVFTNVTGALVGSGLGLAMQGRVATWGGRGSQFMTVRRAGPLILLGCWLIAGVAPLIPESHRVPVLMKLQAFVEASGIDGLTTIIRAAEWFAAALLWEEVASRDFARWLIPLTWMVIPLQLLLVDRAPHRPDAVGAVLGYVLWSALPSRAGLGAALLLGAVFLGGLWPFALQSIPTPFVWVPFVSIFAGNRQASLLVLCTKAFDYGAIVYLANRAGMRVWQAAWGLAGALLLVEFVQRYVPGRIPEISDPLLALMVTFLWWSIRERTSTKGRAAQRVH